MSDETYIITEIAESNESQEPQRSFVPINDLGCYCGELPAIDRPCGCCTKWATMTPESMQEWLDSWGTGPNWCDPNGSMVAISKDSVRSLIYMLKQSTAFLNDSFDFHLRIRGHRDALKKVAKFAQHRNGCNANRDVGAWTDRLPACDCGLDAAISNARRFSI